MLRTALTQKRNPDGGKPGFRKRTIGSGENPCLSTRQRAEFIKRLKQAPPAPPSNSSEAELVRAMNELLPPGSQLFIDASICAVAALRYMEIDPPSEMHNAFNMERAGRLPRWSAPPSGRPTTSASRCPATAAS
jgi:hypothetical protein